MAEGEQSGVPCVQPGWCWDLPCPAHRTQDGLYPHEHHTPVLPASHSWVKEAP